MISCLISFLWIAYVIYSSNNIRFSNALKSEFLIAYFYPMVYIAIPLILLAIGSIRRRQTAPSINNA